MFRTMAVALLSVVFLATPNSTSAQNSIAKPSPKLIGTGSIHGSINSQATAGDLGNLQVYLDIVKDGKVLSTQAGGINQNRKFSFRKLTTAPHFTYRVRVRNKGVDFFSDPATLNAKGKLVLPAIAVHDITSSTADLRLEIMHVGSNISPEKARVYFEQTLIMVNNGKAAFHSDVFAVSPPQGAFSLQLNNNIPTQFASIAEDKVWLKKAVMPGERISLTYFFRMKRGYRSVTLKQTLPLSPERFIGTVHPRQVDITVHAPEATPLKALPDRIIQEVPYRSLEGPLPNGVQTFSITFSKLPYSLGNLGFWLLLGAIALLVLAIQQWLRPWQDKNVRQLMLKQQRLHAAKKANLIDDERYQEISRSLSQAIGRR